MQIINDKKTLILLLILLLVQLLSGCSLTRVSYISHSREVENLKLIGMNLNEAKAKLIKKGFDCSDYAETDSVQTDFGNSILLQLDCSKRSLELFCPQFRYAVLNADPQSTKVVLVGKRINQHSCF